MQEKNHNFLCECVVQVHRLQRTSLNITCGGFSHVTECSGFTVYKNTPKPVKWCNSLTIVMADRQKLLHLFICFAVC